MKPDNKDLYDIAISYISIDEELAENLLINNGG